jgi:TRAP-type mannitol/chloroaromatic compound transport system substrate-binding protein
LASCLEGFEKKAKVFEQRNPAFSQWGSFASILSSFAGANCVGCRNPGANCFAGCGVKDCVKERNVDFCHQCPDYPCDHHGLPPALAEKWRANQDAIKARGLEAWYEEELKRPRY